MSCRKGEAHEARRRVIEVAVQLIEALAVAIILFFILAGTVRAVVRLLRKRDAYEDYRLMVGRTLLVGLELLVAADIIRTAALELRLLNVAALGALVLVRTFLSWTLILEVEGHWPWRRKETPSARAEEGRGG